MVGGFMEKEFDELTEEQLDSVLGGTDFYNSINNVLEHPELYRPDMVDELRDEYESGLNAEDSDLNIGRGGR